MQRKRCRNRQKRPQVTRYPDENLIAGLMEYGFLIIKGRRDQPHVYDCRLSRRVQRLDKQIGFIKN
jgi:hypothetical protein